MGSWKQTNTISALGDYECCDRVSCDVELPSQISLLSAVCDLQQTAHGVTGTEFMDLCVL